MEATERPAIRELRATLMRKGMTITDMARKYDRSPQVVWVVLRRYWGQEEKIGKQSVVAREIIEEFKKELGGGGMKKEKFFGELNRKDYLAAMLPETEDSLREQAVRRLLEEICSALNLQGHESRIVWDSGSLFFDLPGDSVEITLNDPRSVLNLFSAISLVGAQVEIFPRLGVRFMLEERPLYKSLCGLCGGGENLRPWEYLELSGIKSLWVCASCFNHRRQELDTVTWFQGGANENP